MMACGSLPRRRARLGRACAGVSHVGVALDRGEVTVHGERVGYSAVRGAIVEAGYELLV